MSDRNSSIKLLIKIVKSVGYPAPVKAAAIEGLGYAGGAEARAILVEVLSSVGYTSGMKEAAARALGRASATE